MNEKQTTTGVGITIVERSGEMAAQAMAAKQKSLIEARYVIAYNRPRSILQARADILAACQRPGFAESARYKKPVGGTTIDGFSIRFAEEAIKAMKNIAVESTTIYEDEAKRTVQITVTDLESNVVYGKEITVAKTVERQNLKQGQTAISQRTNSYGKLVYLVEATEDDIANKVASAESKIIRNCGLRLVPSDILEEAEEAIEQTLNSGGKDTQAGIKKVIDAFATLNIGPVELEKHLKHPMKSVSPKELSDLRAIFAAVRDGEASWSDYLQDQPPKTKPNLSAKPEAARPLPPQPEPEPKPKRPEPNPPPAKLKPVAQPEQNHVAPVGDGRQFAVTPELAAKLAEMGVSNENFDKWVLASGRADTFNADAAAASVKLLTEERSLKKLQTLYGAE